MRLPHNFFKKFVIGQWCKSLLLVSDADQDPHYGVSGSTWRMRIRIQGAKLAFRSRLYVIYDPVPDPTFFTKRIRIRNRAFVAMFFFQKWRHNISDTFFTQMQTKTMRSYFFLNFLDEINVLKLVLGDPIMFFPILDNLELFNFLKSGVRSYFPHAANFGYLRFA